MNAALLHLLRQNLAPAANAIGNVGSSLASQVTTPRFILKKGIKALLKSPALPYLAVGTTIPIAALEFDRSAMRDQNAAKWNNQEALGRSSEMGDFSKNSELRKLAVQSATTKIAGGFGGAGSFGQNFMSGAGKAVGGAVAGASIAGLGLGIKSLIEHLTQPSATTILKHLMADDPIISRANPTRVMEAYISFKRFAPTLSTDLNATRSYLREALTMGAGPDFSTLANLAKAEQSVAGHGGGSKKQAGFADEALSKITQLGRIPAVRGGLLGAAAGGTLGGVAGSLSTNPNEDMTVPHARLHNAVKGALGGAVVGGVGGAALGHQFIEPEGLLSKGVRGAKGVATAVQNGVESAGRGAEAVSKGVQAVRDVAGAAKDVVAPFIPSSETIDKNLQRAKDIETIFSHLKGNPVETVKS
jgi:hypothetical protein